MIDLEEEGVIKFSYDHTEAPFRRDSEIDLVYKLIAWRNLMFETALIGQDPGRYGGAGYGNLSGRLGPFPGERGRRRFIVSGTQTGGKSCVSESDFCVIETYDYRGNSVRSTGPAIPSSESMTHGAIYDLSADVRFVFHAHSPVLWNRAGALRIPVTDANVPYGTPAMTQEVLRLYRSTNLPDCKVLSMGGHKDGIIVFGQTAEEVGCILMVYLARAYEFVMREQGQLCRYPETGQS